MRRPICVALAVALLPALLNAAPAAYANPVGVPGPNPCGQIAEDRREVGSLLENEFAAPLTASSIAANDTFNTTFLYKPDGVGMGSGNGVWVPLGVFKWGWTASAQNVNGTWMLGSGSKISNLGTAAPSYPSWSGVLTNGSGYSATPNC